MMVETKRQERGTHSWNCNKKMNDSECDPTNKISTNIRSSDGEVVPVHVGVWGAVRHRQADDHKQVVPKQTLRLGATIEQSINQLKGKSREKSATRKNTQY